MCEFVRISYRMYTFQQWLSHTGEAEDSGVAQSMRVDVSAVPGRCWKSLEDSSRAADLHSVCLGCTKKLCPRLVKDFYSDGIHKLAEERGQNKQEKTKKVKDKNFRATTKRCCLGWVFPPNNLTEKIPHRSGSRLVFSRFQIQVSWQPRLVTTNKGKHIQLGRKQIPSRVFAGLNSPECSSRCGVWTSWDHPRPPVRCFPLRK